MALIGVLVVLLEWPDALLPQRFVSGFLLVGTLERSYIFDEVLDTEAPMSKDVILTGGATLRAGLRGHRPQEEAQFLWDSSSNSGPATRQSPP